MLSTIHTKIVATLTELTGAGQPLVAVYADPLGEDDTISGYPSAILVPSSFSNEYMTTAENFLGVDYKIYIVGEKKIAGNTDAYRIMRATVDAVIAKFAQDWDQGVSVDGHRIWWNLSVGEPTESEENSGVLIYYELNLTTNLSYNIN